MCQAIERRRSSVSGRGARCAAYRSERILQKQPEAAAARCAAPIRAGEVWGQGADEGASAVGRCTVSDAPITQAVSNAFPRMEPAVSLAQRPRKLTQLAPHRNGHDTLEGRRCYKASLVELAEPEISLSTSAHSPRRERDTYAVNRDRPSPARSSEAGSLERSTLVEGSELKFGMMSPSRRPRERQAPFGRRAGPDP